MPRPIHHLFAALCLILIAPFALACGGPGAPCEAPGGGIYHAALPEGAEAPPVLVFLHGFGGRGEGVIRNRGLLKPVLARGYAVIAPQGLPFREGRKGGAWNAFANRDRRDDVAFLGRVIDDAAARFGLDRDRVLLGGFSGGGMMTWRVACDAPDLAAAYAPIAGLLWRPLPEACAGPVRLFHTHGWSDPVVPIEGRSVAGGRFTQGDLFAGLDILRAANGCLKDDPDNYAVTGDHQRRKWVCAEGTALEMALHPGGHRISTGWSAMTLDWFEGLGTGG